MRIIPNRIKVITVCFFLALTMLLSSCGYNVSFLIKNATTKDISTILKDYVGLSGYRITYANDETGSYRILVGRATIPASEYSRTYFESSSYGTGEYKTTIGESSSVNIANPPQKQFAALAIQMSQQGNDVLINAQSTGDLDASGQFKAFVDFLKGKGYSVEQVTIQPSQ